MQHEFTFFHFFFHFFSSTSIQQIHDRSTRTTLLSQTVVSALSATLFRPGFVTVPVWIVPAAFQFAIWSRTLWTVWIRVTVHRRFKTLRVLVLSVERDAREEQIDNTVGELGIAAASPLSAKIAGVSFEA